MTPWSRPHAFKVAFILCIFLLLLLNFSYFRSNNTIRATHSIPIGTQWPMPLRPKQKTISTYENAKRSPINQNVSRQNSPVKHIEHAISQNASNNSSTDVTKSIILSNLKHSLDTNHGDMAQNAANEISNTTISFDDGVKSPFFTKLMTKFGLNICPSQPPNLIGPIQINIELESLSKIEGKFQNLLLPGGWYKPNECNSIDRVAIVVPYRDRANHLPIFLNNIHELLIKQQIEYGIFVIEQIGDGPFNRAALMNVGFLEALKLHQWDCFIFHDVDLIPLDDRNLYRCPEQPRHMSVAVDTMGFRLPYSGIFGGVSAMTVKQFRTVNGFSNSFWGWGGEDDDMSYRLKHVGYHIARYPINIARYKMLTHRKEKANPKRYEQLVSGVKKFESDGLNSLKYEVHAMERKILYTWILAEIKKDSLISALASFFTRF